MTAHGRFHATARSSSSPGPGRRRTQAEPRRPLWLAQNSAALRVAEAHKTPYAPLRAEPLAGHLEAAWEYATPPRTECERRAALVGIDASVAAWLGMTADEPVAIHKARYAIDQGKWATGA